jgi:hypothetical protein
MGGRPGKGGEPGTHWFAWRASSTMMSGPDPPVFPNLSDGNLS